MYSSLASVLRRVVRPVLVSSCLVVSLGSLWAKDKWPVVDKAELSSAVSTVEADAPAEALAWDILVDDRDFPQYREVSEYVRYRVIDPEKAEKILRLSQQAVSVDGVDLRDPEMSARVTLPDGSVKEYGQESVRERTLSRSSQSGSGFLSFLSGSSNNGTKEKYLALGTVPAGAVIEYRIRVLEQGPGLATLRVLQMEGIPVRKMSLTMKVCPDSDHFHYSFNILNSSLITYHEEDKGRILIATGKDMPSISHEPFSGSLAYHAAIAVGCYSPKNYTSRTQDASSRVFPPEKPWAKYATLQSWMIADRVEKSDIMRKAAAEITQGASDTVGKARRIHDYVTALHQRFIHWSKRPRRVQRSSLEEYALVNVLEFEKRNPEDILDSDFLILTLSLYRAAGLHAEPVMLPNRAMFYFNPKIVSLAFLQQLAIGIEDGGVWHFSLPDLRFPLAFDQLPWGFTNVPALLAIDGDQRFIEVPRMSFEANRGEQSGQFTLDGQGNLDGVCQLSIAGADAISLRAQIGNRSHEKQHEFVKAGLERDFEGAEVTVGKIENFGDPYKPILIHYKLHVAGYATQTDERLILRPFVFRTKSTSPFPSAERKHIVIFPYGYSTHDQADITLPEGYEIEVKQVPQSSPGEVFSHLIKVSFNKKTRVLHVERDFRCNAAAIPLKMYPTLKAWFDDMAVRDQYSLLLRHQEQREPASVPAPSEPQAAPAPTAESPVKS